MSDNNIQHVVIIDIDGLRRDVLYNTLAEDCLRSSRTKKIPHLSQIVGDIHLENITNPNTIKLEKFYEVTSSESIVANNCVTIFPSYTYPAQSSLFTGLFPNNHGITANFHFDRAGKSFGAKGHQEIYTSLEALRFYVGEGSGNRMLNRGVKTIYDYLHHEDLKCAVSCNFFVSQDKNIVNKVTWDLPWRFEGSGKDIDWLIPNIFNQTQFMTEKAADGIGDYRENFDENMMNDVLGYIDDFQKFKKAPPNIFTLYFGGHDHQAHLQGHVALQRDYLINTVDRLLGKFLNIWNNIPGQNSTKNTLFVICSDHGHTLTKLDDSKRITRKELKSAINRLGYDVLGKGEFGEMELHCNAIVTITAGMAHIYVRKGSVTSSFGNWKEKPSFGDIRPILQEFSKASNSPQTPSNFLANGLDYILFKDYQNKTYQIYHYDQSTNNDIIKPIPDDFGIEKNYVLGKSRLNELYSENSGDIILLPNYNNGFRFEKNQRMRSTHGSLVDSDSYIPLIFSTPYNKNIINQITAGSYSNNIIPKARIVDIMPTILHQLEIDYFPLDGKELF